MIEKRHVARDRRVAAQVPSDFRSPCAQAHLLFVSGRVGLDRQSGLPLTGYRELGRRPAPALGCSHRIAGRKRSSRRRRASTKSSRSCSVSRAQQKSDLLFYSIYVRAMRNFPVIVRTRAALFAGGVAPPSTASQVPGLLLSGCAGLFRSGRSDSRSRRSGSTKQVLSSRHVVQGPLSNYELATRAGDYTFYAGVVGAHPETGLIVYGADELQRSRMAAAGRRAGRARCCSSRFPRRRYTIIKLMRDMLAEHGSGLGKRPAAQLYLRNMAELPEVERIARSFYPERTRPPATLIGVESLARSDFLHRDRSDHLRRRPGARRTRELRGSRAGDTMRMRCVAGISCSSSALARLRSGRATAW